MDNIGQSSTLYIKPLSKSDDIRNVFELCKENKMVTSNYATSEQVWDFQYNNNPIKKSWNAVITNNDVIFGHIGLYPLPISIKSEKLLGGSISNGVLSKSVRNKMLPYKDKKTFAVIPLIDTCCNTAFDDDVDLIFVYSTIHPVIWKSLKFTAIDVESKTTFHSGIKNLYLAYYDLLLIKKKAVLTGLLGKFCAATLTGLDTVPKLLNRTLFSFRNERAKSSTITQFERFDDKIDDFFNEFHERNPNLITYQRNKDYLNWKFSQSRFLKFKFYFENAIIGYIVLESHNENTTCKVVDFLILNEYMDLTKVLLEQLVHVEKISFTFPHYLSCEYATSIWKESCAHGVHLSLSKFFRKKISSSTPLYYKFNGRHKSNGSSINFEILPWFITPIFFTPTFVE